MLSEYRNQCPKCPLPEEDPAEKGEWYQFLTLVFNIRIAREMVRPHMLHRIDPLGLARWIENTQIVEAHVDHLPEALGPGVMVTLPNGIGRLGIDGNHRAVRALRRGEEFLAYLLPERQTRILLRRSMGRKSARFWWKRLSGASQL